MLLGELKVLGVTLTLSLAKRMRRFDKKNDMRYETGRRDAGETRALLRTAKAIVGLGRKTNTMTIAAAHPGKPSVTETRIVDTLLARVGFDQVDAYRYNPASIRLRVIDRRFEGLSREKHNDSLKRIWTNCLKPLNGTSFHCSPLLPSELTQTPRTFELSLNTEFEAPSPSML